jgi:hypothetical protein
MRPPDDPGLLTPELRRRELARLLAAGLRRLRPRPADPAFSPEHPAPENLPESRATGLEVLPETRLSVHTG